MGGTVAAPGRDALRVHLVAGGFVLTRLARTREPTGETVTATPSVEIVAASTGVSRSASAVRLLK